VRRSISPLFENPRAVFVVKKKKGIPWKKFLVCISLIFSTLKSFGCEAQQPSQKQTDDNYTTKLQLGMATRQNSNGPGDFPNLSAGKICGAQSREQEEKCLVRVLKKFCPSTAAYAVADIGAAPGYYTFRIAPMVLRGNFCRGDSGWCDQWPEPGKAKNWEENVRDGKKLSLLQTFGKTPSDLRSCCGCLITNSPTPKEMLEAIHKSLKPDGKCSSY